MKALHYNTKTNSVMYFHTHFTISQLKIWPNKKSEGKAYQAHQAHGAKVSLISYRLTVFITVVKILSNSIGPCCYWKMWASCVITESVTTIAKQLQLTYSFRHDYNIFLR